MPITSWIKKVFNHRLSEIGKSSSQNKNNWWITIKLIQLERTYTITMARKISWRLKIKHKPQIHLQTEATKTNRILSETETIEKITFSRLHDKTNWTGFLRNLNFSAVSEDNNESQPMRSNKETTHATVNNNTNALQTALCNKN